MKSKPQIIHIHGGMTFKTKKEYLHYLKTRDVSIDKKKRWATDYLDEELGGMCDVIHLRMPSADNAFYEEWKINFERYIPLIKDKVIFVGMSLGSIFFAKYLSENKFPRKIAATYLVGAPFDDTCIGEDLCNGFKLKKDLSLLEKNSPNLTFFFSADDDDVPVDHAEKYRAKLPNANIIIYKSKNGHFRIPKFPELVKMIKKDIKNI